MGLVISLGVVAVCVLVVVARTIQARQLRLLTSSGEVSRYSSPRQETVTFGGEVDPFTITYMSFDRSGPVEKTVTVLEVVDLVFRQGQPVAKAAEALGISEEAVWSLVDRVPAWLREHEG